MLKQNKPALFTAGIVFFAAISAIGLHIPRQESMMLGLAYFSAFFGYFWLASAELSFETTFQIGTAVRLILFLGLPSLSDDFYRFIWDGEVLHNGLNPYAHLPAYYLDQHLPGLTADLYSHLNSKDYYAVHPPLDQFFFWLSVHRGSGWLEQVNALRVVLLLAEIGSFYFLKVLLEHTGKKESLAGWFFLNPLVILEVTGNVHFEGLMLLFLMLGFYLIAMRTPGLAGVEFGLSIASKLLPLIFLPALLVRGGRKKILLTGMAVLVGTASLMPLFFPNVWHEVHSSLAVYFRGSTFNPSLYYFADLIGYRITGQHALTGTWMALVTLIALCGLALWGARKGMDLYQIFLFSLSVYLLLAGTVYPWYILPLIAFGLLSGYYYPIVWSLFIFGTYFGYTADGYEPAPVWIITEYVAVLLTFVAETYWKRQNPAAESEH